MVLCETTCNVKINYRPDQTVEWNVVNTFKTFLAAWKLPIITNPEKLMREELLYYHRCSVKTVFGNTYLTDNAIASWELKNSAIGNHLPVLALVAKTILSVRSHTALDESTFSEIGFVKNKSRNRLHLKTENDLMLTKTEIRKEIPRESLPNPNKKRKVIDISLNRSAAEEKQDSDEAEDGDNDDDDDDYTASVSNGSDEEEEDGEGKVSKCLVDMDEEELLELQREEEIMRKQSLEQVEQVQLELQSKFERKLVDLGMAKFFNVSRFKELQHQISSKSDNQPHQTLLNEAAVPDYDFDLDGL